MMVSPDRELLMPEFDRVLKGVTVTRIMALANELVRNGTLSAIKTASINLEQAKKCPEVMLSGTSLDLLPVTTWDGRQVGDGTPGPVSRALLELLRRDVTSNPEVLTSLFD